MKIQQLLQREPFGNILENTLKKFLYQKFATSFRVTWRRLRPFSSTRDRGQDRCERWYCNPYLNAIFPARAERAVLNIIRRGYVQTPFVHRRHLQWAYVTLATHPVTAHFFATHVLEIQPSFPGGRDILIQGGNNRIHLLDLNRKRLWVVLKDGFDPTPMLTEIQALQTPGIWPFPVLRSIAEDHTWFESDYIAAVSLNRVKRAQNCESIVASALSVLGRWLDRTRTSCNIVTYANRLVEDIRRLSETGVLFSLEDKKKIQQWTEIAMGVVNKIAIRRDLAVDLALGHGDFQNGNILVDVNNRIWIIDWEYAGRRHIAYDYLVFFLRSRFPKDLAIRIQSALINPQSIFRTFPNLNNDLIQLTQDPQRWLITLVIFVLEDLLWNLNENSNPLFYRQSGAWLLLGNEIERILKNIVTRFAAAHTL